MSSHIQDAKNILARAKQEYHRALHQVDAKLRAAVAETPDSIPAAKAVQDEYIIGYSHCVLAGCVSPDPQHVPATFVTDPEEIEKALTDSVDAGLGLQVEPPLRTMPAKKGKK
jgi:hypothetical protein